MAEMEYGENSDMSDKTILSINSPKDCVTGPYKVIYKNIDARWTIVALDWEGWHTLGIRWFTYDLGIPNTRGYPTWFIIPSELHDAVLIGLLLGFEFRMRVYKFLNEDITSDQL